MRLTILLMLSLLTPLAAQAEKLTIERIFADPSLDGVELREIKLSPDGSLVAFLRARADDKNHYDLWSFEVESGESGVLVRTEDLVPDPVALSEEAAALRERKRIVGLTGITDYGFSEDGQTLLIPYSGDAFLVHLDASKDDRVQRVLDTEVFETDVKLSPKGNYASYIREQDLYIKHLAGGKETAVTEGGAGPIKYGMAEFVAQEEMRRYTGYWWSPDERYLAYTRVDERPVEIAKRVEYHAETTEVVEQRYPYAGTANVRIALFVRDLKTGTTRELDLGDEEDIYLYRVDWFPDSRHLAVQRQPRDLQSLDLIRYDVTTGKPRLLIHEQSPIWISLQDNLGFVEDGKQFVWSSRRSGYRHLYLYDWDGELIRPLTAGDWGLIGGDALRGVNGDKRLVYFMATRASPLGRHLYVQSLDTENPGKVTRISHGKGIHQVEIADDFSVYVDTFESPTQPPQTGLWTLNGIRIGWVLKNALNDEHPFSPYLEHTIEPSFGTLEAQDGQTLYYRLYKPAGFDPNQQYPVLVYVYGGPTGQQVTRHWPSTVEYWLQYMAQWGYGVFTLDNRGTGNRGRTFDAPIYKELGQVEIQDQLLGVEWLRSQAWVDDDRIGVFGWSYGGYMSLMLLTQSPDAFAVGVSGAPVTDWRLYDTYYTERFMDRPQDNESSYEQSDVLTYADGLADPLLVIHGMADDNVLFKHSTRLFKFLQDHGKPFEMMTYPGAKHSLVRVPVTGPHALKAATKFLDLHLKPPE